MNTSVDKFNSLDGVTASRDELNSIISLAKKEGRFDIINKLTGLLSSNTETKNFEIELLEPAIGEVYSLLNGLECIEGSEDLGDAVSPNEIYDYITKMVTDVLESGKQLFWRKPWNPNQVTSNNGSFASNYQSGKMYRGINYFMLNFVYPDVRGKDWDNPYFLTFNQIKEAKGTLKKGSKGYRVVYFTTLFSYVKKDLKVNIRSYNKQKFIKSLIAHKSLNFDKKTAEIQARRSQIPILKYYNVFNGEDIDDIEWKLIEATPKTEEDKIEIGEAIIASMPKAPPIKKGGSQAFYMPSKDFVNIPKIETFEKPQFYYSTLFHELVHSTKHRSRLDDDSRGNGSFGDKDYAFEELIAELGASYLNAEAGILYYTLDNSAAYIKSWRQSLLKNMQDDNKFFFRATSKAQAAVDFMLDRDKNDIPAYFKVIEESNKLIETAKKTIKKPKKATEKPKNVTKKPKSVKKKSDQLALFGSKSKGLAGLCKENGFGVLEGLGAGLELPPPELGAGSSCTVVGGTFFAF